MRILKQRWRSGVVAIAAATLTGLPAGAQEAIGMKLEAAGFIMREANTPEKLERLKKLPSHKFVRRTKNGKPFYVYADPIYCKCALVGDQAAMNSYRDMVKPITPPPGYRDFAGNISGSGDSIARDMFDDMRDDGEIGMDEDLFQPSF
jgi:hypothetical protein